MMYITTKLLLKANLDQRKVDQGVMTAAVMTADLRRRSPQQKAVMNSSGGSLFIPLGNWQNQMRNYNPMVSSMKLLLWTVPDVNRRLFPKNNVKKNPFTWIYIWIDFIYISISISHHKNTIHIMILCMCQYVSTAYWHKHTIRLHHNGRSCEITDQSY